MRLPPLHPRILRGTFAPAPPHRRHPRRRGGSLGGSDGFSLIELLIVLSILGVVLMVASTSFRGLENDLENTTIEAASFIRQVRARAITTTSAYRIVVQDDRTFGVEFAPRCSANSWQADPSLRLKVHGRVVFGGKEVEEGGVFACFNSRGVASSDPVLIVEDYAGQTNQVELFVGGGVRIVRGAP